MKRTLSELVRFGANGIVATVGHYSALHFCMEVLHVPSAGAANFVAAIFGISASFLGNRYFVFPRSGQSIGQQALKFSGLYAVIALLNGFFLSLWSDLGGLDYRIGFLLATGIQFALSYTGGKRLVFTQTGAP